MPGSTVSETQPSARAAPEFERSRTAAQLAREFSMRAKEPHRSD
ncbi:hypothetical protein [Streptomyces sp. NPDC093568]